MEADLGDEGKPVKESLFARLAGKISRARGGKKVMVIKSGNEEESVVKIEDDRAFISDIRNWYASIKHVPQNDTGKINEAKELVVRASRRARAKVLEEDAMNGEFMLRMMDAWANKKESANPLRGNPDHHVENGG